MGTQYTGNPAAYPVNYTIPDDGDPRTATSVNVALGALGDRTEFLRTHGTLALALFYADGAWVAPAGVKSVIVTGVGGGGGGGGGAYGHTTNKGGAGGGGGGATLSTLVVGVTPGVSYAVTAGAGGTAGAAGGAGLGGGEGGDGGDTVFGNLENFTGAQGGSGGAYNAPGIVAAGGATVRGVPKVSTGADPYRGPGAGGNGRNGAGIDGSMIGLRHVAGPITVAPAGAAGGGFDSGPPGSGGGNSSAPSGIGGTGSDSEASNAFPGFYGSGGGGGCGGNSGTATAGSAGAAGGTGYLFIAYSVFAP